MDDRPESEMTGAEEMLMRLNLQLTDAMEDRDRRVAMSKEYWDGRPRTMLNDSLRQIDIDNHYAQFTLETSHIRSDRERVIDALSQIEMAKPHAILIPVQPEI